MNTATQEEPCCICLEFVEEENRLFTYCFHKFHKLCLHRLVEQGHKTCPVCRTSLSDVPGLDIPDEVEQTSNQTEEDILKDQSLSQRIFAGFSEAWRGEQVDDEEEGVGGSDERSFDNNSTEHFQISTDLLTALQEEDEHLIVALHEEEGVGGSDERSFDNNSTEHFQISTDLLTALQEEDEHLIVALHESGQEHRLIQDAINLSLQDHHRQQQQQQQQQRTTDQNQFESDDDELNMAIAMSLSAFESENSRDMRNNRAHSNTNRHQTHHPCGNSSATMTEFSELYFELGTAIALGESMN